MTFSSDFFYLGFIGAKRHSIKGPNQTQNCLFWYVDYQFPFPFIETRATNHIVCLQRLLFPSMTRTCSKGIRCVSRSFAEPLTADNFRKAPLGVRANQFYGTCNRCRRKPPCPQNPCARPNDRCRTCSNTMELQYFLDSNGNIMCLWHVTENKRCSDRYLYLLSSRSWQSPPSSCLSVKHFIYPTLSTCTTPSKDYSAFLSYSDQSSHTSPTRSNTTTSF